MSNRERRYYLFDKIFKVVGLFCTFIGLIILAVFLVDVAIDGVPRLSWDFLNSLPSRKAEKAGILTAWAGTLWMMGLTALIAFPLGICTAIYLEEYQKKGWFSSLLEINITNLAGVPSIIYGLLGLELFSRAFNLGPSLLTGSLTLSLLILPIIVVSTREALKSVPYTIREASYAMGATKWQTIYSQVLPAGAGGILTGIILSLSRAIGETAPLIVIGALTYVPFMPSSVMDEFTVLPIQIFNWVSRPQRSFLDNAAAAILVLLFITFILNSIALVLRNYWQKKVRW